MSFAQQLSISQQMPRAASQPCQVSQPPTQLLQQYLTTITYNKSMTDKGPVVSAKQLAMSRALGAAFLSHQVEQLEKSVNARGGGLGVAAATASGNWRERRYHGAGAVGGGVSYNYRAPPVHQGQGNKQGKRAPAIASTARSAPAAVKTATHQSLQGGGLTSKGRDGPISRRKSSDEERDRDRGTNTKVADIIVVDASVLVHALYQVKRWCKDGREEIIIVPLEALNTLDLLKKGTTSLAQRARAASRILESQVGTNKRIRVQRDEAFVYWDKIAFVPVAEQDQTGPGNGSGNENGNDAATKLSVSPNQHSIPPPSPEWVRRTVCCAKWETENSLATLGDGQGNRTHTTASTTNNGGGTRPRVVLAVLAPSTSSPISQSQSQTSSPQSGQLKLSDGEPAIVTPVVPLPAPHPHSSHANANSHYGNKFEPRSSGTLVSYWAAKGGIEVVEVDAAAPGHGRGGRDKEREEDDEIQRGASGGGGGGRKGQYGGHGHWHGYGGHGRRKPSVGAGEGGGVGITSATGQGQEAPAGSTGLVERPPAVMAMMEMISQPNKGRVVRVLARGEKLDP
ncbi:hypothetical protein AX15_004780 [Amanita polypyramis BW_CC]|nr:hypothetical protein AX15_004780 [Amanita polypyramis BW_CC]